VSTTLEQGDDGVWRIPGVLDFDSVPALYRQTDALLASGPVELDLAGVERANSAGVALLLEWRRQAHHRGIELYLRDLPAAVLQLARLSDVEGLVSGSGPTPREDPSVGVARPVRRPL
jgi:phospholipid transport system transporter-binding protein